MDNANSHDLVVFLSVTALRVFIPLLIPRFPLPGVFAAFLLDAADQTIYQSRTALSLDGYQAYDKALDVYYLTITYLATLRNWTNLFDFRVSRFLFYFRLVGVLIFEFTGVRSVLLIFPNTFEYLFMFYELVRLRWDPRRMSKPLILAAAAGIWTFIKLPQEYWLHIAEMDLTDFLKQQVFRVPTDSGWGEIVTLYPLAPVVFVIFPVIFGLVFWMIVQKLPPADWSLACSANGHGGQVKEERVRAVIHAQAGRFLDWELVEKVALVSLVGLIFARILPAAGENLLGLEVGVVALIGLNTALSERLTRRHFRWHSPVTQFAVLVVLNFAIISSIIWLLPGYVAMTRLGIGLLYVLLGTLLIVLYDQYQPIHRARFDGWAVATSESVEHRSVVQNSSNRR